MMSKSSPSALSPEEKKVTESIFSGRNYVLPMADVSHIEKHLYTENDVWREFADGRKPGEIKGIDVFLKNGKVYLSRYEAAKFLRSWCNYRHELEFDTLDDLTPSK